MTERLNPDQNIENSWVISFDKEKFIDVLKSSGKFDGTVFDEGVPDVLAKLFFDIKWEKLDLAWKRRIQGVLANDECIKELFEVLQSGRKNGENAIYLDVCRKLLKWAMKPEFRSMADVNKYTNKNIFEVFLTHRDEAKKLRQNKFYRNKKTKEFWQLFSEKMKTIVSERDRIEFFAYTSIEKLVENENHGEGERGYTMYIEIPAKESRAKDEKVRNDYVDRYIKRFKAFWQFFRKGWGEYSEIAIDDIDVSWQVRFDDVRYLEREGKLNKLGYMKAREDQGVQGVLFDNISLDDIKANVVSHSGNLQAINLVKYWLSSQEINIDIPTIPNIIIHSKGPGMGKQCIVRRAKQGFQEMFPNAKIKEITGQELFNLYSGAQVIDSKSANGEEERKLRFDRLEKSFQNINLLIINKAEELNNKIQTQKRLLKLMERPNLKIIFVSQKDIIDFQEIDETKSKKEGYLKEFILKLRETPSAETMKPQNNECGPILEDFLEKRKVFGIGQNFINGIAKLLPFPNIYDALSIEIRNMCNGGRQEFTVDMARKIVEKYKGSIYVCTIKEVHRIVEDYFFVEKNLTDPDMVDRFSAYLCKKYHGSRDHERTNKEIATGLGIKISKVASYISEVLEDGGNKEGLEKKLRAYIQEKEEEMLGSKNLFRISDEEP